MTERSPVVGEGHWANCLLQSPRDHEAPELGGLAEVIPWP